MNQLDEQRIREIVREELKKEAPAGTEAEEYTQCFPGGTKAKINLSIEFADLAPEDYQEILSFISMSARQFYLSVGSKINNKTSEAEEFITVEGKHKIDASLLENAEPVDLRKTQGRLNRSQWKEI